MEMRASTTGDPLDSYGHTYILQRGSLRICMRIRVLPTFYHSDLHGNTDMFIEVALRICMNICVFPSGVLFAFL